MRTYTILRHGYPPEPKAHFCKKPRWPMRILDTLSEGAVIACHECDRKWLLRSDGWSDMGKNWKPSPSIFRPDNPVVD